MSTVEPGAGAPAAGSWLEVGRIGRAHGLRGEVVVSLTTDRTERLAPGTVLRCDAGELVVEAAQPHQDRWIVRFRGWSGRDAVSALRGLVLRAEPIDDPEEMWVHDLVGAVVVTTAGERVGTCRAVLANPAADLLELDRGPLVPVTFVVDRSPGTVTVELPDGLLDL